ncbi:hypothetical protein [Rheinheimera soli]|uniref:Na+/melibiose symporter-like transporter n=1 Tax=Rheinheimera soli TaxID=443616 RepID=A0ABU1W0B2_9GAMM|nr:hypothetical protein [Rheinheimera soli]MDR7121399.1 Na+/melibiose symporter-like transporter [Rheinheimera soli]
MLVYLKLFCTAILTSHSYYLFLASRSSKDAVLQSISCGGLLCALTLWLALMTYSHYKHFSFLLSLAATAMLLAMYWTTAATHTLFWLVLAGFIFLIQSTNLTRKPSEN